MARAIIMAGGEGVRLRPLTVTKPKPMLPFVNRPLLEHIVELLKLSGINEIGMTLHYLPSTIMDHFRDGVDHGVKIYYSVEERPLGTAGGVLRFVEERGWWDEPLLIVSGDLITDVDLRRLVKYHEESSADFTMALRRERDVLRFGIAQLDASGRVARFKEKPSPTEAFSDLINMGIYVVEPEVLRRLPRGRELDFGNDVIPWLLSGGFDVYGFIAGDYYWNDVGDVEQYREAHVDALEGRVRLPAFKCHDVPRRGICLGRGAKVDDLDLLRPPVIVGDGAVVERAEVGPYVVIGDNVRISEGTRVERSIVMESTIVGSSCNVEGAIIGSNVSIGDHVAILEGVVVGDGTVIGKGTVLMPNVRVWPHKHVEPYATVNTNLRWGIRWHRSLVEPWGITGYVNVDLTPEISAKIGAALGSLLDRGSFAVLGNDSTPEARLVRSALEAGILSAGAGIRDMGVCPLPVLTFYMKRTEARLGAYVSAFSSEPMRARIKVFGERGKFADRKLAKRLEETFFRETYRRNLDLGHSYPIEVLGELEEYVVGVLSAVGDVPSGTRAVVECSWGTISRLLPMAVRYMGVELHASNCSELRPPRTSSDPMMAARRLASALAGVDAPIGFVFDSDADKLMAVMHDGTVIAGDRLVALVATLLLENGGGKIILPHSAPMYLVEAVRSRGGRVVFAEQGLVGVSMAIDDDTLMAADERGSIIYPWFHYGPDAFFTMVLLLKRLGDLKSVLSSLPESHVARRKVNVNPSRLAAIASSMVEELRGMEVETMDGIKVYDEDRGWAYIRFLGHESSVEVVAEAEDRERAEKFADFLAKLVSKLAEES
ncbi:MAG: sugar phosphate nucleotidyltransferase [Desulfurococcaceae archaeon]